MSETKHGSWRAESGTASGTSICSVGSTCSSIRKSADSKNDKNQGKQKQQQQQRQGEKGGSEGEIEEIRRFLKQRQDAHAEAEEEEEEEEEGEGKEADRDVTDSSRDDGFLDDFARELDGPSSDDEQEGEKDLTMIGGDGDEQVAWALQEEEWRRNLPPLPGTFNSRPLPPDGLGCRRISSVICSGSSRSSIFYTEGSGGGGTSSNNNSSMFGVGGVDGVRCGGSDMGGSATAAGVGDPAVTSTSGASSSRRSTSCDIACPASGAVADSDQATEQEDCDHDALNGTPPRITKKGRGSNTSNNSKDGSRAPEGGAGKERGQGRVGGGIPAAWPPGGLSEGEGLRINDLPDEIVDKIAGLASLPRCVSKRIERYRVKVVRERVFTALETSAKLPSSKAMEVEDAIFSLCGCSVTKAYKAKAREMSFNLRVGKNDPLRERLLSGSLLPSELVRMSSNELAPLSVRRERERLARKRIREVTSSRDSPSHTVTDRFTCVECGHERTQYRTWRRKAVVDRVRVIVQCLQCRHSWEL